MIAPRISLASGIRPCAAGATPTGSKRIGIAPPFQRDLESKQIPAEPHDARPRIPKDMGRTTTRLCGGINGKNSVLAAELQVAHSAQMLSPISARQTFRRQTLIYQYICVK